MEPKQTNQPTYGYQFPTLYMVPSPVSTVAGSVAKCLCQRVIWIQGNLVMSIYNPLTKAEIDAFTSSNRARSPVHVVNNSTLLKSSGNGRIIGVQQVIGHVVQGGKLKDEYLVSLQTTTKEESSANPKIGEFSHQVATKDLQKMKTLQTTTIQKSSAKPKIGEVHHEVAAKDHLKMKTKKPLILSKRLPHPYKLAETDATKPKQSHKAGSVNLPTMKTLSVLPSDDTMLSPGEKLTEAKDIEVAQITSSKKPQGSPSLNDMARDPVCRLTAQTPISPIISLPNIKQEPAWDMPEYTSHQGICKRDVASSFTEQGGRMDQGEKLFKSEFASQKKVGLTSAEDIPKHNDSQHPDITSVGHSASAKDVEQPIRNDFETQGFGTALKSNPPSQEIGKVLEKIIKKEFPNQVIGTVLEDTIRNVEKVIKKEFPTRELAPVERTKVRIIKEEDSQELTTDQNLVLDSNPKPFLSNDSHDAVESNVKVKSNSSAPPTIRPGPCKCPKEYKNDIVNLMSHFQNYLYSTCVIQIASAIQDPKAASSRWKEYLETLNLMKDKKRKASSGKTDINEHVDHSYALPIETDDDGVILVKRQKVQNKDKQNHSPYVNPHSKSSKNHEKHIQRRQSYSIGKKHSLHDVSKRKSNSKHKKITPPNVSKRKSNSKLKICIPFDVSRKSNSKLKTCSPHGISKRKSKQDLKRLPSGKQVPSKLHCYTNLRAAKMKKLFTFTPHIVLSKLNSTHLRLLGCNTSCPILRSIEEKEGKYSLVDMKIENNHGVKIENTSEFDAQMTPLTHLQDLRHISTKDRITYLKGLLQTQRANAGL